jgi:hypothetical protein
VDYYQERVARYLELAEAAEEAAGRASSSSLQETYVELARQWAHLAWLAEGTKNLALQVSPVANGEAHGKAPHHAPDGQHEAHDSEQHEAHGNEQRAVN